jgi:retron-type reverse transcriptase
MGFFGKIIRFFTGGGSESAPQQPPQPRAPQTPHRPPAGSGPSMSGSAPAQSNVSRGSDANQTVKITAAQAGNGATVEVTTDRETLLVKIPAGARDGQRLRIVGKGNPGAGGNGDLILELKVLPGWAPPASWNNAPAQPAQPAAPSRQTPASRPAPTPPSPKRQNVTLNLDASKYTGMAGSDIKSELAGKGDYSWSIFRNMAGTDNTFWGNRSVIPPSTDPRTIYIDRGMVGQGLVTAEELVEIHAVGDQMLVLRPALDQARTVANLAVEKSKEEKAALVRKKKAEAEARKKKHAEDVAHRKATDIIFLGRGVSKGLADRRANVEKLQAAGLPVLASPADVAQALGMTIPQLRWLSFHTEATPKPHYVRFTVPKKSGGTRELAAPHQKMAAAQEWILKNILEKIKTHEAAHGFVAGRSTVTNARPHAGQYAVVNCDLKDFFPTVNVHRVIGVFVELGYSPAAATVLALICTECPRRVVNYAGAAMHVATGPRCLPQGACTSPAISNLVSRRMDSRLAGICRKLGFVYTRYADDLSFSASAPEGMSKDDALHPNRKVGYLLARIRHITQDEGFIVNEKKTRLQRRNTSQRVTGIVVNTTTLRVPRKTVRKMRAILHQAKKTGLAAQNKSNRPNFEGHVRGMISYIEMINPQQAMKLRAGLMALPPQ